MYRTTSSDGKTQKKCSKCKIMQPPYRFRKRRSIKSGLNSWCKACSVLAALKPQIKIRYFDHSTLIGTCKGFCSTCKKVQPVSKFGIRLSSKWGRSYTCKSCRQEEALARTQRRLMNAKPKITRSIQKNSAPLAVVSQED